MNLDDKFTERAKAALTTAHETAADMGHGYVGSEHILYGVSKENGGIAAKVLRSSGIDSEMIMSLIE